MQKYSNVLASYKSKKPNNRRSRDRGGRRIYSGLYGAYRYVLHYLVDRKFASLKAQGYATTIEDLRRMYPYPEDGPNAADLYLEAAEKMEAVSKDDEEVVPQLGFALLPDSDEKWSGEMKIAVRRYLNKNRESLDLLHRAAEVKNGYMIYSLGRDKKDDGEDGFKDVSFRIGYPDCDCD